MIARSWDGMTETACADEYVDYLRRTGVADCTSTPGNRGVYVLRRVECERTSFRFVSLWDSLDDVRRFAGPDLEKARYYPEDGRFLIALEEGVEHYEVSVAQRVDDTNEVRRLADELSRTWQGEAWHGPALADVLVGISAGQAATQAIPGAHTLWELVLHVTAWDEVFRRRLEGVNVGSPEEGDFPPVPPPTAEAWARAQEGLHLAHAQLVAAVDRLTRDALDAPVPQCDYTARFLIHGAIRHIVYHTGQMVLLRNAARPAPTHSILRSGERDEGFRR